MKHMPCIPHQTSLKLILFFAVLLNGLVSSAGANPVKLPVEGLLDSRGVVHPPRNCSGMINLSGFSISLDEQYGVMAMPAPPPNATWSPLGAGLGDTGYEMAFDASGSLYVCGDFITAGGVTVNHVAKWDGCAWSALGTGTDNILRAIAIDHKGNIYVGGNFVMAGGIVANNIAKWDGTSWSALGTGVDAPVYEIVFDNAGNLIAGGCFVTAGGISANCIGKWDGSNWSAIGAGMDNCVVDIELDASGNMYAGGWFEHADGLPVNYIAKWNGSSWTGLGNGMNERIQCIEFDANQHLYAGGWFTVADNSPANGIAKWNGSTWSALGAGVDNILNDIKFDALNHLIATGHFVTAGGTPAQRVAMWDGSQWSAIGSGMNGPTTNLLIDPSGNIYVTGIYSSSGGNSANNIAVYGNGVSLPLPVGYFPFNGNANDSNIPAVNGTVNNATLTAGYDGAANSAYHFDGFSSWIDLTADNRNITNAVSIAAWIKTSASGPQWVAGKYSFPEDHGFALVTSNGTNAPSGKMSFSGRDGTGNYHTSGFTTSLIDDGKWHCMVGTAGSNNWKIYVDGALESASTNATTIDLTTSANELFTIGWHTNPNLPLWFDGDIDDVRIYNRELSPCEIDSLCSQWPVVSVKNQPSQTPDLLVYPNPASDHIIIAWEKETPRNLRLTDLLGRPVRSFDELPNAGRLEISLEGLPAGACFLVWQNDSGEIRCRVIEKM